MAPQFFGRKDLISLKVTEKADSRSPASPLHVLVADARPQVRSALALLLHQDSEDVTVDEAWTVPQMVKLATKRDPHLVLLDWALPEEGGATALQQLRAVAPQQYVIVLSGDPGDRERALNAGANAFISKIDPPELLRSAIRRVWQARQVPPQDLG